MFVDKGEKEEGSGSVKQLNNFTWLFRASCPAFVVLFHFCFANIYHILTTCQIVY